MAKYPFRTIPPATLDAPFARFAFADPISFRHSGGVPIFDSNFDGGVPKFYGDSEGGGMRFLGALFLKRTTPPNKKFWTVPNH